MWHSEIRSRAAVLALALWAAVGTARGGAAPAAVEVTPGTGSYAVVVSRTTHGDPAWRAVVDALREPHAASVIVYPGEVAECIAPLAKLFPRYACFVARPEEAGRPFVVAVHRLTRKLDGDPYTDVVWGILTGYEAADALRIAQRREPLVIRRAAGGTGINLGVFDEGVWFSEGERGVMWEKRAGGTPEKKTCPADSTKALVDTFNEFKPQLFVTSGHATTRDWQIGYSYRDGQFRCHKGQLFGLDLQKKAHLVQSPNPKVYLPVGNCLIGWIPGRECMALAFMRTAGVHQMFGYVVPTWYGYMGWGVLDLFVGQPGRFSLAEAVYLNNQALIHQLAARFPKHAGVDFERFDLERDRRLVGRLAAKHGVRDRDALGLLWDRDTVAFYGDPAWDARLAPRPCAWEQSLTEKGGTFTFQVVAGKEATWRRPPMALLPWRVRGVEIIEGKELSPLIADNFLLLPAPRKLEPGKRYRVVLRAERVAAQQ